MGCDIHIYAEKKMACGKYHAVPVPDGMDDRSYGCFAFLAGVRNYSGVTPVAEPRGIPDDISDEVFARYDDWRNDAHTPSWLLTAELMDVDYDASIEDRRVTRQIAPGVYDGGVTAPPGEGVQTTWREFLGESFINAIQALHQSGAERVVFWFDN